MIRRWDTVICIDDKIHLKGALKIGHRYRVHQVIGELVLVKVGKHLVCGHVSKFDLVQKPKPKELTPEEIVQQRKLAKKRYNETYRGKPGSQRRRDYLDEVKLRMIDYRRKKREERESQGSKEV